MSVYNAARFLEPAVRSICQQSDGDFEFLIVNDGSADESAAILDRLAGQDVRIRVIHQRNSGLVASLNRLLDEARAPLFARMDGDDIAYPDRFALQRQYLGENPDVGLLGCSARFIDEAGQPHHRSEAPRPLSHEEIMADTGHAISIHHPSMMARTGLLREVGGYRRAYQHCEDYDLFLRLSRISNLANLPDQLLDYRISATQVSNSHTTAQTYGTAVAWLAHRSVMERGIDPTEGLNKLPALAELDAIFDMPGAAKYVRRKVINRILYSPEALAGEGFSILREYIADEGRESRLWRAAVRLARAGRPRKAAELVGALIRG